MQWGDLIDLIDVTLENTQGTRESKNIRNPDRNGDHNRFRNSNISSFPRILGFQRYFAIFLEILQVSRHTLSPLRISGSLGYFRFPEMFPGYPRYFAFPEIFRDSRKFRDFAGLWNSRKFPILDESSNILFNWRDFWLHQKRNEIQGILKIECRLQDLLHSVLPNNLQFNRLIFNILFNIEYY